MARLAVSTSRKPSLEVAPTTLATPIFTRLLFIDLQFPFQSVFASDSLTLYVST